VLVSLTGHAIQDKTSLQPRYCVWRGITQANWNHEKHPEEVVRGEPRRGFADEGWTGLLTGIDAESSKNYPQK
jgi:hypothetical protein